MDKALLVNDDEQITERIASMLELFGYEVHVATSETLAARSCVAFRPDVVIVDIEMEGGIGFESIAAARRSSQDALVVAITRGTHKEIWPKVAQVCGARGYVVGPVSSSKLMAAIELGRIDPPVRSWKE